LQSSTFSTTWSTVQATVTANSTTAPDGTLTADTLVPTAVLQQHRLDQTTTITAAAHNASVYAKAAGYGFLWMRLGTLAGIFNLSTGAITSLSGGATGTATDVGNGWWRCSLQGTTAGSDTFRLAATPTASTADYTGDGTSGIYLWGAQIELGVGASSPIPTTTAAVTRAADVPLLTGLSVPDGSTLVLEGRVPAFITTDARTGISTNDNANRTWFVYNGTTLTANVTVAGGSVAVLATAVSANAAFKAAVATSGGAYRAAINGGAVATGSGAASATMTQADIGTGVGGSSRYWNNTISRIRIYNRALPDAQLQSLTS
jgi:hypothetical protein